MDDIEKILKATIQTKVVEAFNSAPEVVEKLVEAALSKEVDEWGGKPNYGSSGMPYMEYLVGEEIRKAVRAAVAEYIAEEGHNIPGMVREALKKSDILSKEYNWSVNLNIDRKETS